MQKLFNITPVDVGRTITDLASNLRYNTLEQDVNQVINSLAPLERVAQSKDGRWFNIRILPQMESSDVVCSVIVAVADITKLKQKENNLVADADRIIGIINNFPIVVWNQDTELRYMWIHNPHPGFVAKEVLGKKDEELLPAKEAAKLTNIKQQVLDTGVGMWENIRATI